MTSASTSIRGGSTVTRIAAAAVGVVAIALIGLAVTLPWWTVSSSSGGPYEYETAFYFGQWCSTGQPCLPYQGTDWPAPIGTVLRSTQNIVIVALGISAAALVAEVLSWKWRKMAVGAMILGGGGLVACIASVGYAYSALPPAAFAPNSCPSGGFSGSAVCPNSSVPGTATYLTWGGGQGWYVVLGAAVVLVVFVALLILRSRSGRSRPRREDGSAGEAV